MSTRISRLASAVIIIGGSTTGGIMSLQSEPLPTPAMRFMPLTEGMRPLTDKPPSLCRVMGNCPKPKPQPVARTAPSVSGSSVWDRLAQCESGGNWQTNTGNGYQGGLQFHPSTWRAAGGTRYAPSAHQASREQQIAVAESWLAKTSWSQWPACSRKLGLR